MQLRQPHALARPLRNLRTLPVVARRRLHQSAARTICADGPPELPKGPSEQQKSWDWQPRKPSQPWSGPHRGVQSKQPQAPQRHSGKQQFDNGLAMQYTRRITKERSIGGIVQLVQAAKREGVLNEIHLAAALDCAVKLDKRANSPAADGAAAWSVLRPLSMKLIQAFGARQLVALLRAAAHFDSFSADELSAWQAALKRQQIEDLPEIPASNALLSLSTLASGSEALKAAVDASLVVRLVQRWLQLVPDMLSLNVCQGLYGAACLGYPFSQQELGGIMRQAIEGDGGFGAINGTQLFRAWSLLDVAWRDWNAKGQLSVVAAASKRHPEALFRGNKAVQEVLQRVLSRDMDAQGASQALLALGQLRFRPPAAIAGGLVDVYFCRLRAQQYTAVDLTAFLDGCALLGCRLSPAVLGSCLEAVSATCASNSANAPRCISTAAWALAHLQQCDLQSWQRLAGLAATMPVEDWSVANLCRLYQAYMHVRAEHGQAVQLPAQVLLAASSRFLEDSIRNTISAFHSQMARELEAACPDQAVEVQQQVGPGGCIGEAALEGRQEGWLQVNLAVPLLRLVVEADGPSQYFRKKPAVPLPTTLARNRLLRSWGWHVISVPSTIPKQRLAEYLKQRLPHR